MGIGLLTCVGGGGAGAYTYTTLEGGGGLGEMLAEFCMMTVWVLEGGGGQGTLELEDFCTDTEPC